MMPCLLTFRHLYFCVVFLLLCHLFCHEIWCLKDRGTKKAEDPSLSGYKHARAKLLGTPVKREISLLPASSPQEIDVKFRILYYPLSSEKNFSRIPRSSYLPANNTIVYSYSSSMDELNALPLDTSKKTIYLMHGWLDTLDTSRFWWSPIVESVKKNKPQDYQIIFVDWSRGSSSSYYLPAVSNMRVTADMIASSIRTFIDDLGFNPLNIRLIGFSLGAHLAGFTGKLLTGRRKLAWITGLEPANAMFEMSSTTGSIYKTDAHYVDIIHSASGNILQGFSKIQPLGHRDYYINGANVPQPGCHNEMPFGAVGAFFSYRRPCSHDRAPLAFSRAKDNEYCSSIAFECGSHDDFMGGHCSRTCDPRTTMMDSEDSGCYWFGFTNDILHRNEWPPCPPSNREFQTLFMESNGIHSCLSHYKMDIRTGKTDNPSSGTFVLTEKSGQLELPSLNDIRMSREFSSFRSNIMLIASKRSLDNIDELSLNWQSSSHLFGSLLPVLPLLGHHSTEAVNVQRVSFESMNPSLSPLENRLPNASVIYNFCGLHSRQEIKTGSRLILVRC